MHSWASLGAWPLRGPSASRVPAHIHAQECARGSPGLCPLAARCLQRPQAACVGSERSQGLGETWAHEPFSRTSLV